MSDKNDSNSDKILLGILKCVNLIVLIIGVLINYKLYCNIKKETPGEKGKVLQRIMKNYSIVQALGWSSVWLPLLVLMVSVDHFGTLFHPCIYVYGTNICIFFYCYLRFYIGLNSLVIAFGRYAFVVHDHKVLKFGVEKLAKILIWSSFLIPLLMTILCESVVTLKYNGWLSKIGEYELSCYSLSVNGTFIKSGERGEVYKFPIYKVVHSILPSWATSGLYIIFTVITTILYSNITEGIIYIKSALFLFRSENKEHVLASLSEESIRKRRRRNTIGIQITVISWMLEFLSGFVFLSRYWMMQTIQDSEWTDRMFGVFDIFVSLVLIPSSYLLNDEAVKLAIQAIGWTKFCRSRLERRNDRNHNN